MIETLSGQPLMEIKHEQEEEEKVMAEVEKLQSAGATIPADLKASIFPRMGRVIGSGRHQKSPKTPKSAKGTPRFSTPYLLVMVSQRSWMRESQLTTCTD